MTKLLVKKKGGKRLNSMNVGLSLFSLVSIFNIVLLIVGFACLIQLFRLLTKGIQVLEIIITENKLKRKMEAIG